MLFRGALALIPTALAVLFLAEGNVGRGIVLVFLAVLAWWRVLMLIRAVVRRVDARKAARSQLARRRAVEDANVAIMQRATANLDRRTEDGR